MYRIECSPARHLNNLGYVYALADDWKEAKRRFLKSYKEEITWLGKEYAYLSAAYANLSNTLVQEAKKYLSKRDYFSSFMIAWVSIEMFLRHQWVLFLAQDKKWSKERIKEVTRWNIPQITEILNLEKKINDENRDAIIQLRKRRNEILHVTGEIPSKGC